MLETDVLILGSGLAGSLTALALAKKGIKVTLVSSKPLEDLPRSHVDSIDHSMQQPGVDILRCARAFDYLNEPHQELISQFFPDDLLSRPAEMIDAIRRQVQENHEIHKLFNHIAVELLSLERHSLVGSDIYKKPTCLGAYLMDRDTEEVFPVIAKETIIATGGHDQLYLYHTHSHETCGSSIAFAHQVGARTLNVSRIEFYPAAVKHGERYHPIPSQVVSQWMPRENPKSLAQTLFQTSKKTGVSHAMMKLTFDTERVIEQKYPQTYQVIQDLGIDPYQEAFPVTPVAEASYGGIVVDKFGQTTVQRLHAVGSAACTGIHGQVYDRAVRQRECIVWSLSCAEDIASKIRKFAYYFPKIKSQKLGSKSLDKNYLENTLSFLKRIMWDYAGIQTDLQSLRVAEDMIHKIHYELSLQAVNAKPTPSLIFLEQALRASKLVVQDRKDSLERVSLES